MDTLPCAVALDVFDTICHGHDPYGPYARLRDACNLPKDLFRKVAMTQKLSLTELVTQLKERELNDSEEAMIARADREVLDDCAKIRLFTEVVPTLTELRDAGIPYGFISNLAQPYAPPVIELLDARGLLPPLERCLWSFEEGVIKPDPVIFQRFCDRVGEEPSRVLVVGDKERNDLHGPRSIGCQSRLILRGENSRGVSPEDYIVSLAEIPRLLGLNVSVPRLTTVNPGLSPDVIQL